MTQSSAHLLPPLRHSIPDQGRAAMAPTDKDRVQQFREYVSALNKQFLEWTGRQWTKSPTRFWSTGLQDYLRNVAKIRREFADVLTDDGKPARGSVGGCGA